MEGFHPKGCFLNQSFSDMTSFFHVFVNALCSVVRLFLDIYDRLQPDVDSVDEDP